MGDAIGWIANVFMILGSWNTGNKKRIGFLLIAIGEVLWIIASTLVGTSSMIFICFVFALLAIRNWFKWGDEIRTPPTE